MCVAPAGAEAAVAAVAAVAADAGALVAAAGGVTGERVNVKRSHLLSFFPFFHLP